MRSGQVSADDESPSGILSTTKGFRLLPIPPQPPFQIEAKCEVFVMKSVFIHMQLITITKISHLGRFPFDQIFWFEIPGILCDEWNSIFRFVGLTNPRSSGSKFRAKIRDQTEGSFTFVYLLWGCWTTLKLK